MDGKKFFSRVFRGQSIRFSHSHTCVVVRVNIVCCFNPPNHFYRQFESRRWGSLWRQFTTEFKLLYQIPRPFVRVFGNLQKLKRPRKLIHFNCSRCEHPPASTKMILSHKMFRGKLRESLAGTHFSTLMTVTRGVKGGGSTAQCVQNTYGIHWIIAFNLNPSPVAVDYVFPSKQINSQFSDKSRETILCLCNYASRFMLFLSIYGIQRSFFIWKW